MSHPPKPLPPIPTRFAPAERASNGEVVRQSNLFTEEVIEELLNAVTNIVLVLNRHRQIVYSNKNLLETLNLEDRAGILGLRPGELFKCEYAAQQVGGCGTTEHCRQCGAVRAVMDAIEGRQCEDECRITSRQGSEIIALDFKVRATPLDVAGERFVVFAIDDISHEKRRRSLERIFFHDIMNTVGGLSNLVELISLDAPESMREDTELLRGFFNVLVDEINSQKLLLAAECAEATVEPVTLRTLAVLENVKCMYEKRPVSEGRNIVVAQESPDISITTDTTMLIRILGNLLKNALEASADNDDVVLGCREEDERVFFWVRNNAFIPRAVQLQIFHRSFSTKGQGRGLGTYSVKLLTEMYLQGSVWFDSSKEEGTTFFISLPKEIAAECR